MKRISVKASKTYDVLIDEGVLPKTGEYAKKVVGVCSAAVITDDIVDKLYSEALCSSLSRNGFRVCKFVFPNGENSKNMETLNSILNFLAENQITRADAVFALGGGVVGDIAGFAAGIFLRGIRFIQIPTTLLAAVDSSVGGKTAVNLERGKNLAGIFHQPELVLCDTSVISKLPEDIFTDGCAEVIKYGIIKDRELFNLIDSGIREKLSQIIARCVEIKSDVVSQDEFDTGIRMLLNFGHTLGHAVEKLSAFTVSHGRAVAAGMAVFSKAADGLNISDGNCHEEIVRILKKNNLPAECGFNAEALYKIILSDKKRAKDTLTIVVPKRIGECVLMKMPVGELLGFIKKGLL